MQGPAEPSRQKKTQPCGSGLSITVKGCHKQRTKTVDRRRTAEVLKLPQRKMLAMALLA